MALAGQGWTTPLWFLPRMSVEILGSGDPDDVDARFVRLYELEDAERLDRMIEAFTSRVQLSKWRLLLTQASAAYRRQEYPITVPAFLVVLEGLLMGDAGNSTRVVEQIEARVATVDADSVKGWLWLAVQRFVQELYLRRDFCGERPELINRHWILHGRDSDAWSQADALRLMQAIEVISDLEQRMGPGLTSVST